MLSAQHQASTELSHRESTGQAIRRGEIKISDPIPSSYVHNDGLTDHAFEQPSATPRLDGNAWLRANGTDIEGSIHRDRIPGQATHVSKFTERTSLGPSLAASNMSSVPSKDSSLQRRGTGLRATLRRMFGSKKGRPEQSFEPPRTRSMRLTQPPAAFQPSPIHYSSMSHHRALNSHAPSPHLRAESENVLRPTTSKSGLGPRRNTEPNLLAAHLNPVEGQVQQAANESAVEDETDVEEQERVRHSQERPRTAVRRDTPPPMQFKRRSRSADALAELMRAPASQIFHKRGRSEEIAFWRNSVVLDPIPPLPNAEQIKTFEAPYDAVPPLSSPRSHRPRPSLEPAQDFDFGLGDTITSSRSHTLQERVNTLEVKLYDFEFALAKLRGVNIDKPRLPKKPSPRKSLRDVFPESGSSSMQDSVSTNGLSYTSSSSDNLQPLSPHVQLRADRTSKATTIRPIKHRRLPSRGSQHSSHSSIHFSKEEYDTLRTLIEGEKSARQQLEIQVLTLQKEVDILKSPVYAYVRPAKYPTPSPDSVHHQSALTTPRLKRSPKAQAQMDVNETSRFSMSETEPETDHGTPCSEVYETPQEQYFNLTMRRTSPPGMI